MPGKFFEYIGARRPILALVTEGEVRDIVVKLRRGEVASLDDPALIAEEIGKMYGKYVDGTLEHHYDLSEVPEYRREILTAKLAACLDSLAT